MTDAHNWCGEFAPCADGFRLWPEVGKVVLGAAVFFAIVVLTIWRVRLS